MPAWIDKLDALEMDSNGQRVSISNSDYLKLIQAVECVEKALTNLATPNHDEENEYVRDVRKQACAALAQLQSGEFGEGE